MYCSIFARQYPIFISLGIINFFKCQNVCVNLYFFTTPSNSYSFVDCLLYHIHSSILSMHPGYLIYHIAFGQAYIRSSILSMHPGYLIYHIAFGQAYIHSRILSMHPEYLVYYKAFSQAHIHSGISTMHTRFLVYLIAFDKPHTCSFIYPPESLPIPHFNLIPKSAMCYHFFTYLFRHIFMQIWHCASC